MRECNFRWYFSGKSCLKLAALMIMLMASCEDPIRFETPQPEGTIEQHVIPRKYHGRYLSLEDSSILIISRGNIVSYYRRDFRGTISDLDSSDRVLFLKDTTFSDNHGKATIRARRNGDQIEYQYENRETIFSFARHDVLKKFRGYYFLNHETEPAHWSVTKLGFTKEGLVLGSLTSKDDLTRLRELTQQKSDTVYNFKPTAKQMKKFIRDKGFHNEERFVKIKR